jgi:hypothetical protein
VAAQVTGFVLWPVLLICETPRVWVLPIALILISCGWWENFITATKDESIRDEHFITATNTVTKKEGKRDKITIYLHYTFPPATFPSGTTGTYQQA